MEETKQDRGLMVGWKNRRMHKEYVRKKESDEVDNGIQKIKRGEKLRYNKLFAVEFFTVSY
jgi:hypothetical protein